MLMSVISVIVYGAIVITLAYMAQYLAGSITQVTV